MEIENKTVRTLRQGGFTLLEILVVLTIMGFLIAMVAPRLAGLSSDASQTVCDTNKYRAKTYMSSFYEKYSRYPNNLTNLVMTDGADLASANGADAGYQVPYCSDDDPGNGPEVIHSGHNNAYKFMIHRLNRAEADELIGLGITRVYNLNDYAAGADGLDGAAAAGRHDSDTASTGDRVTNWGNVNAVTDKRPAMELCPVSEGVGVAMCGCGIADVTTGTEFTLVPSERAWAEEDIFGRIAFALGPESELVSSGIVTNAANCPGSIQNADNFTYGGYYLILPRLEATAARMETATFSPIWGSGTYTYAGLSDDALQGVSWPKAGPKPGANYNIGQNTDHFKIRTGLKLCAAMDPWDYDVNRQRYDEVWGINLNGNPVLNGGN